MRTSFRSEPAPLADRAKQQATDLGTQLQTSAQQQLEELEPVVLRTKISVWELLRRALTTVLLAPALLVRGLGSLASSVDDVAERGGELADRGRDAVHTLPPSRRTRRRTRVRGAGAVVLAFGAGVAVGELLARRRAAEVAANEALEATAFAPPQHPNGAVSGEVRVDDTGARG